MKAVFGKSVPDMAVEVEKYREHLEAIREEAGRLRARHDVFECEGFTRFRNDVLLPEIERLARVRMQSVDPESARGNLLIQGQWNEAVFLAEQQGSLKARLKLLEREEAEVSQKLTTAQKRLDKALGGRTDV